jgi:hypothetical protein
MKNMPLYSRALICLICLITIGPGCKKEFPEPGHPGNDDWLLHKIYQDREDGGFLQKEYIYGDMTRPWLDITYYPPSGPAGDTAQVDTLLYNAAGMLIQVNSVFITRVRRSYLRKTVGYNAAGRIDTLRIYDPNSATPLLFTFAYTYSADARTVMRYGFLRNDTVRYDSTQYFYDNMRNLSERRIYPVPFVSSLAYHTYSRYDDCDNIYSHLNMNVYLPNSAIVSSASFVDPPFISKNNPRIMESTVYTPDDFGPPYGMFGTSVVTYTTDSLRLIRSSVHLRPGGGETSYRYEYIPGP